MMSSEWLLYGSVMSATGAAAAVCYPALADVWARGFGKVRGYQQGKVEQATKALDDIFLEVKPRWLKVAYGLGPLLAGAIAFVVSNNVALAGAGAVLGVVLPDLWVRQTRAIRRRRFEAQLLDALFILSSSLKAGLSLRQAFETLESEMPPPASQEFGLMIKAHRLGQSLEDALERLNVRMPSEDLNLVTTAILMARESGGDVTGIIGQLVTTIRERRKLADKVKTLTLQGRLQAYIMSALPVGFAFFVRTFNPRYFDVLLHDATGVMLIGLAVILWVLGMVLLLKFSRVEV